MAAAVRGGEKKDGGVFGERLTTTTTTTTRTTTAGRPLKRGLRPLADIRGDDGMIGGLLEAHHK